MRKEQSVAVGFFLLARQRGRLENRGKSHPIITLTLSKAQGGWHNGKRACPHKTYAPGADMGTNGPRDFGGLLRPVARLFLVMTGELGLLQTGDEDTRSAAPPKADPRTTEDYQGHFFIHTRRGWRGGKVDCFYKGQTHRTQ